MERAADPHLVARLTDPGLAKAIDRWWDLADLGFDVLLPAVAEVLDRPIMSDDPAVSFVLHAPLELLARAGLHRHLSSIGGIDPATERASAARLVSLAVRYAGRPGYGATGPDQADVVPPDLGGLAERVVDATAAAGHGNVYVHLRRSSSEDLAPMTSGLLRELDLFPAGTIELAPVAPAGSVDEAMADLPGIGAPPGPGIAALVRHAVAAAGPELARLAATVARSYGDRLELLRCAAGAMVVGADGVVPYGWTHALTLAQGALSVEALVTDPVRATTAAAVHAGSFWAAYGSGTLPSLPAPVAAHEWIALARGAIEGHDAHLVKHTLACVQAAGEDPAASGLYAAAAGRLHAWWSAHPPVDDPLAARA